MLITGGLGGSRATLVVGGLADLGVTVTPGPLPPLDAAAEQVLLGDTLVDIEVVDAYSTVTGIGSVDVELEELEILAWVERAATAQTEHSATASTAVETVLAQAAAELHAGTVDAAETAATATPVEAAGTTDTASTPILDTQSDEEPQ